ncbi:MAG: pyridoxal phosphate-dependent aminotransferase [Polyangiaceae bacterium]|nr:pyridoxal phosphate-dependent aminotransferase [Polyangiaceae bacterium]
MTPSKEPSRFSRRASFALEMSAVAEAFAQVRASAAPFWDLTETNPTRVGLRAPEELVTMLGDPAGARYEPQPFGLESARDAVAASYRERGIEVRASRVVLGSSTSEAYSWAFKLLADAGDEVLVPSPSYPLFEYLAGLEGVVVATYPLVHAERFRVDVGALERRIGPRTRAIVVVSPNNPTGTLVREEDAEAIDRIAAERGLAVVADEVFGLYLREPLPAGLQRTFIGERRALTLVMSGLSKECCAPQLKLGWTVACGPDDLVEAALARLEVIADTYLSVSTPVQVALPKILAARAAIVSELRARIETNLRVLDDALAAAGPEVPIARLPIHGGWTALVTVPRIITEEAWVLGLARERRVLVQPGFFFDLTDGGVLALGLITVPDTFRKGVEEIVSAVRAVC